MPNRFREASFPHDVWPRLCFYCSLEPSWCPVNPKRVCVSVRLLDTLKKKKRNYLNFFSLGYIKMWYLQSVPTQTQKTCGSLQMMTFNTVWFSFSLNGINFLIFSLKCKFVKGSTTCSCIKNKRLMNFVWMRNTLQIYTMSDPALFTACAFCLVFILIWFFTNVL